MRFWLQIGCALFPELVRDWVVAAQLLHSNSYRSAFSARSAGLCLAVRIAIFMAPCSKGLKFISRAEHMLGCCNPDKSLLFFIAFDLSEAYIRLNLSCQTNVHSDFKTQSPSEVLWLVQCYRDFCESWDLQSDLMTTGKGLRKRGGFAADDSVAGLRVVGVAEWGTHPQGVSLTKRQTSWGSDFWNFDRS